MKYRLLKKLFDIEPQTFHTVTDNRDEDGCVWLGFEDTYRDNILVPKVLIDNPDWFEPLPEHKNRGHEVLELWVNHGYGNTEMITYLAVRPEAAEAVAEAIKETLAYIIDPQKQGSFMGRATYKARQLLQEPTE